jgi:hypothetical protein
MDGNGPAIAWVRADIYARSGQNCLGDRIDHNNHTGHFFGGKRIGQESNSVEMMAFITPKENYGSLAHIKMKAVFFDRSTPGMEFLRG